MSTTYSVDRKRWAKMNIFEQMGNISSEVGRSFNARLNHNEDSCKQAIVRAIDLFDATTEVLIAKKSPRVKEVLRAKESYLTVIYDQTNNQSDSDGLQRYFMQYAIAARLSK